MKSLMRTDVREAHLRLDFEEDIQLLSLILFCVFFTGLLNGFNEIMIIHDRVALLMRTQHLHDFAFELINIPFHDWVDDLS